MLRPLTEPIYAEADARAVTYALSLIRVLSG